jgi:hypothetical protein
MRRWLYLTTLLILQLALVCKLTPPLAQALSVEAAPGLAPGGWPAMLQLVATAAAIVGTSLVLIFPGVALSRHRRAGPLRFCNLPRWAITLALGGAVALGVGLIVLTLVPMLPIEARMTAVLIAKPIVAGGLALSAAGVLSAELLHRGVAATRATADAGRGRSGRVEVTQPPELRTRIA